MNLFLTKSKSEKNYKKLYYRMQIEFIFFLFIFGFVIYSNYDYLLFKVLIAGNYIYTDTLDKLYDETLSVKADKQYFKYFDDVSIKLFTDKLSSIDDDKYTSIFTPEDYSSMQSDMSEDGKSTAIYEKNPATSLLRLTNFSNESFDVFKDNIDTLKNKDYLIIDLRDNTGGDLPICYKISDYFLDNRATISYENTRLKIFSSHNIAKNDKLLNYKHIYILQNKYTASSSEVFINALKENLDNVTTIGTTSYGKGIGQATYNLKNGFAIRATVLTLQTPNGNSIHKVGIKPDIFYFKDDIEDFALSQIS